MICCYPRCRDEYDMEYLRKPLCWKHWTILAKCEEFSDKENKIRAKIKLKPREKTKCGDLNDKTKTNKITRL